MRDDFEIVPARLDAFAAAARDTPGCFGARLTGGGFGGATVNVTSRDAVERVRSTAEALGAVVHVCRAAQGVEVSAIDSSRHERRRRA